MTDGPGPAYESVLSFFAELVAHGVRDVVISPGSRSTPLAVSARHVGLRPWVQLDERSAGFFALGLARASGRAVPLVCTSGTAVANYLPAVVEASHAGVPLLVCTADRPPELRGWGAGQTVDQLHRYGRDVRWFVELPVGPDMTPSFAARVAARALAAATGRLPGPVHLNFPFREPLEPLGPLDAARQGERAAARGAPAQLPTVSVLAGGATGGQIDLLVELARSHERGLLLPGPCDLSADGVRAVVAFASAAGWPVLADPGSQLRRGPHVARAPVLAAGDHLAKVARFTGRHRPDVVVRLGLSPTSKALRQWIEREPPDRLVLIGPGVEWSDPTFAVTDVVEADPVDVLGPAAEGLAARSCSPWTDAWLTAEQAARAAVTSVTQAGTDLHGAAVVEVLGDVLPEGAALYASNSMPVRELDMFLPADPAGLRVFVNRGANGIDGMVACSLGVAAARPGPVVLLTGDVALVHDAGSLLAARRLGLPIVIVVVDNGGGGIFSYLPIATHGDTLGFTELFLTPPEVDLPAVGAAAGMEVTVAKDRADLAEALQRALGTRAGGQARSALIHVPVDHDADVALHRRVTAAVTDGLPS